ncbi:unnamed protein product [Adineta steineri]|uniref:G-protein coupled receptors family 1 profile domain-containing protein n=1 Tax=Adineta steineri TaxID=433720 RepID=A0A814NZQ3_9BILA|nr:unnamed protein product [Adineta steineri]CAF1098022.1 unnamed protein product [Adineta steineri]CAF1295722.1 unnamed protein product [Adineta steineri]
MQILYRIIVLILFSLVYVIGLVGNGLLIFIVFRQKNLRTVPNLLVVSLALGDFLFVLFCVPFGAVAYSLEYYPFSTFYCRFENFIINLSLGVSVFSLLALSADRYKIIAKPLSSHANDPSNKLKIVVLFIWLFSACLAIPETIYSGIITEILAQPDNSTVTLIYCWSPNEHTLLVNHTFMIIRQILRLIIYYLLPFIFISIFYSIIAKTLFQTRNLIYLPKSSSRSVKNDFNNNNNNRSIGIELNTMNRKMNSNNHTALKQDLRTKKQLQARQKVAKTVLFLCLVFFICWLPKQLHDLYWFIGVLVYSSDWNLFWQINKTIGLILTYIYSCINPFALYFLSSTFRHFYKRHLCFWSNTTCHSSRKLIKFKNRHPSRQISITTNYQRRSSLNNSSTFYDDLNRIKTSKYYQQQSP